MCLFNWVYSVLMRVLGGLDGIGGWVFDCFCGVGVGL